MSAKRTLFQKKVLLTCGPTWVPVDSVRVISNTSTGELGQLLAVKLKQGGARVTLLEGPVNTPLRAPGIRVVKFRFYDELARVFKKEARKPYDVIVHAAAVADYQAKRTVKGKLNSNLKSLTIDLIPTAKVINAVKRINPRTLLVGFKLEPALTRASAKKKAQKLITEADCGLVVANSAGKNYKGFILDTKLNILARASSRRQMTQALVKQIKRLL